MSGGGSMAFSKLKGLVRVLLHRYRISWGNGNPTLERYPDMLPSKFGYGSRCSMHQGLRLISSANTTKVFGLPAGTINMANDAKGNPPQSSPPKPGFSIWAKWLLGSILTLLLPLWKIDWQGFLRLEGKVENAVEEAEVVTEVVEKVATAAEKVSAEIAEKLPDNSKLKEAALLVEHASSVTAKDAQITQDFIHTVVELKQDLKDLEAIVEPVIDKIKGVDHGEK